MLVQKNLWKLVVLPLLAAGLFAMESRPVMAQTFGNESIHQLEEQVRQLTGKVEELNFMVLQMQTQMDELRNHTAPAQPADKPAPVAVPPQNTAPAPATPPQAPSSVRFDAQGKVLDEGNPVPEGGNTLGAVPQIDNPDELYNMGYQHLLAGDYRAAETVFRNFIDRFPQNMRVADATFWLGEALYGQKLYREAGEVYLNVQKNYQGGGHGPENLLKLAMSMARLGEKDLACQTLAKMEEQYPNADPALLVRLKDERGRNKCP